MTEYSMRPQRRKPFRLAENQPDLFAWAETRLAREALPTETLAIRTIARRYGVPVHLARVIAEAANIGARA
jgi:hypothetical protein